MDIGEDAMTATGYGAVRLPRGGGRVVAGWGGQLPVLVAEVARLAVLTPGISA